MWYPKVFQRTPSHFHGTCLNTQWATSDVPGLQRAAQNVCWKISPCMTPKASSCMFLLSKSFSFSYAETKGWNVITDKRTASSCRSVGEQKCSRCVLACRNMGWRGGVMPSVFTELGDNSCAWNQKHWENLHWETSLTQNQGQKV